jgi:hypothetical protein
MRICNQYCVPGLAGYSRDGQTIYIDKRLPRWLTLHTGRSIDTFKYLAVHESTERKLEYEGKGMKYQEAHALAEKEECKAVEADGIKWSEYQGYMLKEIEKLDEIPVGAAIPHDLDLKPEIDMHAMKRFERYSKMQKGEVV